MASKYYKKLLFPGPLQSVQQLHGHVLSADGLQPVHPFPAHRPHLHLLGPAGLRDVRDDVPRRRRRLQKVPEGPGGQLVAVLQADVAGEGLRLQRRPQGL